MDLYKVADITFGIDNADTQAWDKVKWHYGPFIDDAAAEYPSLTISITKGSIDLSGKEPYFSDNETDGDSISIAVYRDTATMIFELHQPHTDKPNCWITLDDNCTEAKITLDEDNTDMPYWMHVTPLTAAIQLAFIMVTSSSDILMGHASSVAYDGKAYLFIAKSGTGKSTHTQLWLKHIDGSLLLNDDHPIVRVLTDGTVMAYGSPWSGKTHCYKNLAYPVGAIVRIKRSAVNSIHPQPPVAAYASLSTSFSGFKWHKQNADMRHRTLEKIVKAVPCYVLECRPDEEAARVCFNQLTK